MDKILIVAYLQLFFNTYYYIAYLLNNISSY
jgi:hypothetical protein